MLILKDEFQEMLRIVRESSVANIGFTDSLAKALNGHSLKELSDEGQRRLIQSWLYPTNDDGEIEKDNDIEVVDELWNDDDSAEQDEERKNWYRERALEFEFHTFVPCCSMCGKCEAYYIAITKHGTPFEFCKVCRDEIKIKKDTLLAAQERIGA